MLDVLKPDEPEGKQGEEEQQAGGEGGQQQGAKTDAVRLLAELKMLKLLQQEVNSRTAGLDQAAQTRELTADEQREYVVLGEEQGKLANLALNFAEPMEPEAADDPGKIPELDDLLPPQQPRGGNRGLESWIRAATQTNVVPLESPGKAFPGLVTGAHSFVAVPLILAQGGNEPPPRDSTKGKSAPPSTEDPLLKKLNQDLFNDLDKELFDGVPQPKNKPPADAPAGKQPSTDPDLDRELMRGLDGEDIGQEEADPLVTVGRRMREVESLIAGQKTGQTTQEMQQQIVKDLDTLIREMRNRSQSQSSSSSSQQQQQTRSGKPQQPQSAQSGKQGQQRPGNSPARDSTSQLNQNKAARPDKDQLQEMMKHVWGHLPQREREQMQQSMKEEFLPQYELQIEQYFKALVEQPAAQP
jgi:hypothetical protein